MKQDWEIAVFENCLEKVTYTNKIQRKDFKEDGNYPIISQEKDFINGYWDNEDDLFKVDKPVVIFGDHTQVIKFVNFDFVLGADGVKILKPKEKIEPKYFYYYLQSIDLGRLGYARHYRLLKEVSVTYPKTLTEQQRIVAILDEAFAAIDKAKANAEQNLRNAKEIFESYLQGVFEKKGDGWEERTIKEVCELKSGTTISPNLERSEGDVLYVKVGDMTLPENEVEINTSSRFVNSSEINSNQIIPIGATIFPKRGGAIATNKKRKIIKPTIVDLNTMAIIPGNKIDADYFYHWFQLIDLICISNGTSIPQINNYSFDDVKIPFPKSKEAQQTIIRQLDTLRAETRRLEAVYKKKINDLEELKKSILQKAFEGELQTSKAEVLV